MTSGRYPRGVSPDGGPAGSRTPSPRGSRRALLVLIGIVGAIAVGGGGAGIVLGAVTSADPQRVAVATSSEYRFLSGVWLALGLSLWWSLVRPETRAGMTRIVLIVAITGGLGRLVSLLVDGWPGAGFVSALVIELIGLPLLLWWHLRIIQCEPST